MLFFSRFEDRPLLVVCDKHTGQIIFKEILQKGRGPNEYFLASFMGFSQNSSDTEVWMETNAMRKIICLNLDKSLSQGKPIIEYEFNTSVSGKTGAIIASRIDNENMLYVAISLKENNVNLLHYNTKGSSLDTIGRLFNTRINFTDVSATYSYHPAHPYYITGMLFFNCIYFYSINASQKSFAVCVSGNIPSHGQIKNTSLEQRKQYYLSSFSTDNFICLLYNDNNKRFLHLLNWDGSIKKVLELDYPINTISYDESEKTVYGIQWNNETVYRYKLPI
ncbi:MAG: hypothetical protein RR555_10275 [Bacteroidales bacterium]